VTTLTKPEDSPAPTGSDAFLSVRDLHVRFSTEDGVVKAVDGISFDLERGTTLGIVGESGSGKSVTNLTVLGLHNPMTTTIDGEIILDGKELITATEAELEKLRGNKMAMIFQDALTALSPYHTVGRQIGEPFRKHTGASKKEARDRAIEMLAKVGIPHPKQRVDDYPHQFSGGMRQRAMIAMSLVCNPDLLIADEPTTALDVTVQAQTMALLRDLQREFGTAIVLITHDLGVVAGLCDEVMVLYGGRVMEQGSAEQIFYRPTHPYTIGLLGAAPRLEHQGDRLLAIPGMPPSMARLPAGCPFSERCALAQPRCTTERPPLVAANDEQVLRACHRTPEDARSQGWTPH
jgi:peptide/nickel transport system ATP-binding protein